MKKILKVCSTLIAILFFHSSYSQELKLNFDTTYIKSYRDYLVVTFVTVYNSNTVEIDDNDGQTISYATNLPLYLGLSVDYKWLTFEYTKNIKTSADNKKGKTDSKSLGFGITGRKFWFRSFWKDYHGYYMQYPIYNSPDLKEGTDPYQLRPDLHTTIYYANLNYGFNYKKFSNTASLWQIEKQKKHAGSFTIGLSAGFVKSNADSSLVLSKWEPNFHPDALMTDYQLLLFGINGGYLHTFPLFRKKNLFTTIAIIPGLSYQYGKAWFENKDIPIKKHMLGSQGEFRFAFGCNHNRYYWSLSLNVYSVTNTFSKDNSIIQNYSYLRLVYGRKIKLRETKSEFLKKIGL